MMEFIIGFIITMILIVAPYGLGYLVSADDSNDPFEIWIRGLFTIVIIAIIYAIMYGIGTVALHISNF